MSDEHAPTIREALVQFQQALDDYEGAYHLALVTWDKVQVSGEYAEWEQARDKYNATRDALLNARAGLAYTLEHWEAKVL